jgi:hypothetical protein
VVKKAGEFMFLEGEQLILVHRGTAFNCKTDVITADDDEPGHVTKGGGKKRKKENVEIVGQMDSFVERSV